MEASGGVRIAPSQFGTGVFATRTFRARQKIASIDGERFDDPEYGSDYCVGIGNSAMEPDPPFRFLNHSCHPNCELVEIEYIDEEGGAEYELWLNAVRSIRVGEELTIDYAWPAEAAIPCGCGAAACRGWIVASEDLHRLRGREPLPAGTLA